MFQTPKLGQNSSLAGTRVEEICKIYIKKTANTCKTNTNAQNKVQALKIRTAVKKNSTGGICSFLVLLAGTDTKLPGLVVSKLNQM